MFLCRLGFSIKIQSVNLAVITPLSLSSPLTERTGPYCMGYNVEMHLVLGHDFRPPAVLLVV